MLHLNKMYKRKSRPFSLGLNKKSSPYPKQTNDKYFNWETGLKRNL